jgi:hypothetical protein
MLVSGSEWSHDLHVLPTYFSNADEVIAAFLEHECLSRWNQHSKQTLRYAFAHFLHVFEDGLVGVSRRHDPR